MHVAPGSRWLQKQIGVAGTVALMTVGLAHVEARADVRSAIPQAIAGFRLTRPVQVFTPNTLEDHIDGQAQSVKRYLFRQCYYAIYAPGGKGSQVITVDIYQMGSPLDAFGYYSYQLSPSAKMVRFVPIGAQGYLLGGGLSFWKGPYYVNVNIAASNAPASFRTAQIAIARAVAAKLSGTTQMPEMLRMLPAGYVPFSQKYQRRDIAGQRFLQNGVSANYTVAGRYAELFICAYPSPAAAQQAYNQYMSALDKPLMIATGAKVTLLKGLGQGACSVTTRFSGYVVVTHQGRYVVGIDKAVNPTIALKLVREAVAKVP